MECSVQHTSTINAWAAVGVGAPINFCVSNVSPTFTTICIENGNFNSYFSLNVWPQNATVTWIAPSNWEFSASGGGFYLYNIIWPTPGSYTLTATITSAGQTVERAGVLDIITCNPNCLPGDPCGFARKSVGTGVDEIVTEPTLALYPNPASSRINIDLLLPRKEESLLTIVDMMGRTVMKATIENNCQLDLDQLSNGVYTVIISNSSGKWMEKIIVKH